MDIVKLNIIINNYLDKMGNENNILTGSLLSEEVKSFLQKDANPFLIGLIADQSVKAEIAWSLPYKLKNRMNTFGFIDILNNFSIHEIEDFIKIKPALHRFPSKMAQYIYLAIKDVVEKYEGDASNIWVNKTAKEIVTKLEQFKGISHKKASLGTLLLVRDMNLKIVDMENIDIAYDVHIKRIFKRVGLVEEENEENVLLAARKLNPIFPGKLTTFFWAIGRDYCYATEPKCKSCPLGYECKENITVKERC